MTILLSRHDCFAFPSALHTQMSTAIPSPLLHGGAFCHLPTTHLRKGIGDTYKQHLATMHTTPHQQSYTLSTHTPHTPHIPPHTPHRGVPTHLWTTVSQWTRTSNAAHTPSAVMPCSLLSMAQAANSTLRRVKGHLTWEAGRTGDRLNPPMLCV